jgi:hypothetical protein
MLGTTATWPDISELAALASDTALNQGSLDSEANTFPQFSTDQAAAIASAQRDLQSDAGTASDPQSKAAISRALAQLLDATTDLTVGARLLSSATVANAKISGGLPEIQPGGQKYSDFVAARDQLLDWKTRMETLRTRWQAFQSNPAYNQDPFSLQTEASCEFGFSRTKSTAVALTRVDRMPGTTGTNPETVLSVTVECTCGFNNNSKRVYLDRSVAFSPDASGDGERSTVRASGMVLDPRQFRSSR